MLPDTLQRRLESIPDLSKQGKRINGLSRLIAEPLLWEQAYTEIASNRGALTPGVTGETLDGFSLERVAGIIKRIRNGTYRFTPVRRVLIPKANGKTRPLGIPTANDKLVQAVVKLLLELIYEPVFSIRSHGFRRGRSCHTALEEIKDYWTGVKWLVDVDVVGFFDNIDHGILLDLLSQKIDDERFLRLIEGMLKAGYMENWSLNATYSGTPQGGVASPILANIYLNELDEFLTAMKVRFDRGKHRAENPQYGRLTRAMYRRRLRVEKLLSEDRKAEAHAVLAKIRELETERSTMPSKNGLDPNYKRLLFCRYADDFLIGMIGSKAEAREVMQEVTDFLRHHLRLEASPEKSKVSKASDGTVFLGYTVETVTGDRVRRKKLGRRVVRSRANADRVHLRVPRERLVRFNQRQGYGDLGRLKAMHRRHLIDSSMLEIVLAYNAEMRGIANYYRLAHCAKFSLRKLWFLWETSLLKTLAFKLRLSVNQIARRLKTKDGLAVRFNADGKERSVGVFNLKHIDLLPPLGPIVDYLAIPHFTKGRSDVMDRLRARRCEYCGSTENPCEIHHSRRLADVKGTPLWKQVAAARRRKRVVLCLACHKALHAGRLKPLGNGGHASTESRMMGNYHVRFGGRERHFLIEARPSRPNAELGAAFLSNEAGILDRVRFENSAAYLASWIAKLENDPRMIVAAASQAQRSTDFIMGIEQKESIESQLSPEGMPLTWARDNGIDTRIPGFAHRDNDEDGVSNLREWKHGTKPNDRLSMPRKQGMSL